MNSPRIFLRAAAQNLSVTMVVGTGIVAAGLIVRAQYRSQLLASEFQSNVLMKVNHAAESGQSLIRSMENQRIEDVKRKDAVAQRLHLQNVEQRRAIDRLMAALKVCQVDVSLNKLMLPIEDRTV
jgi:hypothetical protein